MTIDRRKGQFALLVSYNTFVAVPGWFCVNDSKARGKLSRLRLNHDVRAASYNLV